MKIKKLAFTSSILPEWVVLDLPNHGAQCRSSSEGLKWSVGPVNLPQTFMGIKTFLIKKNLRKSWQNPF